MTKDEMKKTFYDDLKDIKIESCKDLSDDDMNHEYSMKRIRLTFKNKLGISIIQGNHSYGGKDGRFEIAPIDKNGNLKGKILGIKHDDVEGHLSESEVIERIKKISKMGIARSEQ